MRKLTPVLILGASLLAATQAQAISRYNSLTMTCAEANEAAAREGAVILRYPSQWVRGLTLFERAVRDRNQCANQEIIERRFVSTSDMQRCPVRACATTTADDWLLFP